jgi:hypothetical protein
MEPMIPVPSRLLRVEVTDQYGTVAEVLDLALLDGLTAAQRTRLAALASTLIDGMAAAMGTGQASAREAAIAQLTRLAADEAAYQREAARRGLLPL